MKAIARPPRVAIGAKYCRYLWPATVPNGRWSLALICAPRHARTERCGLVVAPPRQSIRRTGHHMNDRAQYLGQLRWQLCPLPSAVAHSCLIPSVLGLGAPERRRDQRKSFSPRAQTKTVAKSGGRGTKLSQNITGIPPPAYLITTSRKRSQHLFFFASLFPHVLLSTVFVSSLHNPID